MTPEEPARLSKLDVIAVLLIWAVSVAVQFWQHREFLGTARFPDPDDALRLVQVRDWLAGQSWFDVTQYRIAPPGGVPMHWSRLVDVPLSAAILLLEMIFGAAAAESIAIAIVPVLVHLIFLFAVYMLSVRVSQQRQVAVFACVMSALAVGIAVQFRPMRIDHHGWQIALTVLAVAMAFAPSVTRRAAVAAGVLMAVALMISIECLPMAICVTGVLGLRYLRDPDQIHALNGFLAGMTASVLLLLLLTSRLQWVWLPVCDAMSVVHAMPLLVLSGGVFALSRIPRGTTVLQRVLALAAVAVAAGCAGLILGQGCLAGLFPPLIRELWYENVKEGLPVWRQSLPNASLSLLSSLLGMTGSLAAALHDGERRRWRWIELLILQAAAFAVSVEVNRAMAVSHALALPGNAWLLLAAFDWSMRRRSLMGRVAAGLACLPLVPQFGLLIAVATAFRYLEVLPEASGNTPSCFDPSGIARLDALPPGLLFAPLDVGPAILVNSTRHTVVATGHHRNAKGIFAVVTGFRASPAEAEGIVRATGARYVVFCHGLPELNASVTANGGSLAASLAQGEAPAWLAPVHAEQGGYSVYKVTPAKPPGL